jgi:hypothetical protein
MSGGGDSFTSGAAKKTADDFFQKFAAAVAGNAP